MNVAVTPATNVSPDLVAAFSRLLPQLSAGAHPLSAADLQAIIDAPGTTLLVARAPEIVGTVTLVHFRIPSGPRARIESMVVDQGARNQGVGAALCRAALERARHLGVNAVDLTSAPARQAANRLYQALGFERRDTNVYRFWFEGRQTSPLARGE